MPRTVEHIKLLKITKTRFIIHRILSLLSVIWYLLLVYLVSNNNNMDRMVVISVNTSILLVISVISLFSRPKQTTSRFYQLICIHLCIAYIGYACIFVERLVVVQQVSGDDTTSHDGEYLLDYALSLVPLTYFIISGFVYFNPVTVEAHPLDLIEIQMNALDLVKEDEKMEHYREIEDTQDMSDSCDALNKV
eukprot:NODE_849_length_3547_cov_0.451856.p2 type:complete len:192 gc:universal NODE_849_length_3547_cov_0.451856:3547-2972(-)